MGDEDDCFVPFPQSFDDAVFEDAGIFDFVEKDDRGVGDDDGVGDEEGTGLAAGEGTHPHGCGYFFSGEFVGKVYCFVHEAGAAEFPGPQVHGEEFCDCEVGEAFGVLGDHGDWFFRGVPDEVFGGFGSVDENFSSGDGVSLGENLDVVDECGFSRAGRADDGDGVSGTDGDFFEGFGISGTGGSRENGQGLYSGVRHDFSNFYVVLRYDNIS